MTRLYLLRHGIAVPHAAPDIPDDERPLTSKGVKRMHQVARGLRCLDIELDRIVTSPLPRARTTAEIVADVLGMEDRLEIADALRAEKDAGSIRDWLITRTEARLMLVGHNPSLMDLIGLLIAGAPGPPPCELRKGGVAALSTQFNGHVRLDWLARPSLLRRLSDAP
jgi:phosphohistidine phosphatase